MSELAEKLMEHRQHIKSNVQAVVATLEDHHARGIPISPELAAAVPIVCAQLMKSDNPRHKASGAKLVVAALKHNLEISIHADKVSRLNSGLPTENQAIKLYGVDAPVGDV